MSAYRRTAQPGGTWFFTVNCANRTTNACLIENILHLRQAFKVVMSRHPFVLDAIVILPDHLHCLWTLPQGDTDYITRWRLIKSNFSRSIPQTELRNRTNVKRGERGIWQRRYWEHLIRNNEDYQRHVDYIHWNPVKHGHVQKVADWPWSSFRKFVAQGVYSPDWAYQKAFSGTFGE